MFSLSSINRSLVQGGLVPHHCWALEENRNVAVWIKIRPWLGGWWEFTPVRVREKNFSFQEGCPGCECALIHPSLCYFSEGHVCLWAKRMWSWDCPSVVTVFCVPQVVIQSHFWSFFPHRERTDLTDNIFDGGLAGGRGGAVVLGVVMCWLVCFYILMSCYWIVSILRMLAKINLKFLSQGCSWVFSEMFHLLRLYTGSFKYIAFLLP